MNILSQLIVNSLIAGATYTVVVLGFNLIYGTVKFFDFGYGAFVMVGGYSVHYFANLLGLDIYLSILMAIITTGFFGFLINISVYKKLRKRKASSMVLLVASIGVFTLIQAIIAMFFSSRFQTLNHRSFGSQTFNFWGGIATDIQVVTFITGLVLLFLLALILKFTLFGKAVRAVSDDIEVSKIVGIKTEKIIGQVVFIGSAIAGMAGILVGLDTSIEPTMGFSLLFKGVIAATIGGVGNIYGGVLGAFFLGFVENFGIWHISGEWKDAIAFSFLIIFLLFKPNGIWGCFSRRNKFV